MEPRRSPTQEDHGRKDGKRVRHIPLSDYAVEWLSKLVPWDGVPQVFVHPEVGTPWSNPEEVFRAGKAKAGLLLSYLPRAAALPGHAMD